MQLLRELSALTPSPVFASLPHSLGQSNALSDGESANQQSTIATAKKPRRKGERLMDLIKVFIFQFICLEVAMLNARTALQFAPSRESPAGMRIRRRPFSFIWLNPGPVGFRIARSGDPRAFRSRRTCFGRSQDGIERLLSGRLAARQAQTSRNLRAVCR